MSTNDTPTQTPNVVVESPNARRVLNVIISSVALVTGTAIVVDGVSPDFDISQFTVPVSAGLLYVASFFNIAVTLPNVPRR
jgi:hypothetical protein